MAFALTVAAQRRNLTGFPHFQLATTTNLCFGVECISSRSLKISARVGVGVKVTVERDSVCMADDIEARHEITLDLPDEVTIAEVLEHLRRGSYLASIAGGKATWAAIGRVPLAIVAQQLRRPLPLVVLDAPFREWAGESPNLDFRYHVQRRPEDVWAEYAASPERWASQIQA